MSILKKIFSKTKEEQITSYADFWNWFQQHEKQFHRVVTVGYIERDSNYIVSKFLEIPAPVLN